MQQQCSHDVRALPIVATIDVDGHPVAIRYPGTLYDLCGAWARELAATITKRSLPVNATIQQERTHTHVVDCGRDIDVPVG